MIINGWVHCPICKSKTKTKVKNNTEVKNFPLFCHKCKNESIVDITSGRMTYK